MAADLRAKTLVIGIGGMGRNVLQSFISEVPATVLIIDTDAQALTMSTTRYKLLIGQNTCHGIGTGRDVGRGKEAAARSLGEIKTYLDYVGTIILAAGLGGGTGSGAIQVIARYALDLGKQVFCVVSTPFRFEGKDAELVAQETMRELDHIKVQKIVLNNQDLLIAAGHTGSMADAFKAADEAIYHEIVEVLSKEDNQDSIALAIVANRIKS